jgi:hypothetical protein
MSTKRSWIVSWTRRRDPAWQLWPERREDAGDHALDRLPEVGVVEDDVGRLAAELERDRLQVARGELVDLAAAGVPAGESDVRRLGMDDQGFAHLGAETGHDVHHAVGETRLREELGELQHRGGRELRGLDHRRAAHRERRRELPAGEREGRVPRRDDHHHALGLVPGVGEDAFLVGGDHVALHLVGEAGVILEVVAHVLHLGHDLGGELAVVALLDVRQPLGVGLDQLAQLVESLAALARRELRPRSAKGAVGRLDAASASARSPRAICAQAVPR